MPELLPAATRTIGHAHRVLHRALQMAFVSRSEGIKPFPWLSVVRHFNRRLGLIYGPNYKKTYRRVHDRGCLRKRRVSLKEFDQAAEALGQAPDVARVA